MPRTETQSKPMGRDRNQSPLDETVQPLCVCQLGRAVEDFRRVACELGEAGVGITRRTELALSAGDGWRAAVLEAVGGWCPASDFEG